MQELLHLDLFCECREVPDTDCIVQAHREQKKKTQIVTYQLVFVFTITCIKRIAWILPDSSSKAHRYCV